MIFEWDEEKAKANLGKHRFSFPQAMAIFLDPDHVILEAARVVDGESRVKAVGKIKGRFYTAVFVMREGRCRLISARRSNLPEERSYEAHDFGSQ